MPDRITAELKELKVQWSKAHSTILSSFQAQSDAFDRWRGNIKTWDKFVANCDEGLSSKLTGLSKLKGESLSKECTKCTEIVKRYIVHCGAISGKHAELVENHSSFPIYGSKLMDKLNEMQKDLIKLKSDLENASLLKTVSEKGKNWSEQKKTATSNFMRDVKLGLADKTKDYERDKKKFKEISPYFDAKVLDKFLLINTAKEKDLKSTALKLLPLAEKTFDKGNDAVLLLPSSKMTDLPTAAQALVDKVQAFTK